MKFGKNLMRVVETSDPEWGPYWMNYKFLKRKINDIVEAKGGVKITDKQLARNPGVLSKSAKEVEFFRLLRSELKKASDFFAANEQIFRIRKERIWAAFEMLENADVVQDKNTWTRLLMACVKFYKDVLLMENFAIMNYCGFSKILKKHDKMTGFVTREAFMRNVMNHQNFTHYPYAMQLIREAEQLFASIQRMESVMPLQDEERLFIEAMRDLNHQASMLQAEEKAAIPLLSGVILRSQSAAVEGNISAANHPVSAEAPALRARDGSTNEESKIDAQPTVVSGREGAESNVDARLTAAALSAFEAAQRLLRTNSHSSLPTMSSATSPTKASMQVVVDAIADMKHTGKRTAAEAELKF